MSGLGALGGLDKQTQIDHPPVLLTMFEQAMEAFVMNRPPRGMRAHRVSNPQAIRSTQSQQIQQQRRRRDMRQFCTHNCLNCFLTVTSEQFLSRDELRILIKNLIRRVRRSMPCNFPILWVVEGGEVHGVSTGKRTHVHLLASASVARRIVECVDFGFVDLKELKSMEEIRAKAIYMAKDLPFGTGQREIRTTKGFRPVGEKHWFDSPVEAELFAEGIFGRPAELTFGGPDLSPHAATSYFWNSLDVSAT